MTIALMHGDRRVESREQASLISSAKVQGGIVYRINGQKLGRIEHLMIDKISGRIAYAVVNAGNRSGEGPEFYPLPWSLLTFNERLGGYELDVTDAHLNEAPRFGSPESWDWSDLRRGRRIHDYWSALPYWGF